MLPKIFKPKRIYYKIKKWFQELFHMKILSLPLSQEMLPIGI